MIRLVLRVLAYLLLAAAFAIAVTDTTRSVENEKLVLTPLEQVSAALSSMSPSAFTTAAKSHVPGVLWDPVTLTLLRLPAVSVLAAVALALFWLARRRRPGIGFRIS